MKIGKPVINKTTPTRRAVKVKTTKTPVGIPIQLPKKKEADVTSK